MKFSKGDIVVCVKGKINAGDGRIIVEEGKTYEVYGYYMDGNRQLVYLIEEGLARLALYADRFEFPKDYEPNPILRKIKKMEERFNKRKVSCAA